MVWSRLKAWLFGGSEEEETGDGELSGDEREADDGAQSAGESERYRCAVCGTEVDNAEENCPLCGSSDLNPVGEAPGESATPVGEAEPADDRVENDGVDPAERLKETRETLLARHEERWERDGEGYRVRDADGEWHRVEDEDAVRAFLRE